MALSGSRSVRKGRTAFQGGLEIRKQIPGLDVQAARTLYALAWLYYEQQSRYKEAEQFFKEALEIRNQVLGAKDPETAETLHELAKLYQDQGRYKEAEQVFKRYSRDPQSPV